MKAQAKYIEPVPPGFMRHGHFNWPALVFTCPGYRTHEGQRIDCGNQFESTSRPDHGQAIRCRLCRVAHQKERRKAKRKP